MKMWHTIKTVKWFSVTEPVMTGFTVFGPQMIGNDSFSSVTEKIFTIFYSYRYDNGELWHFAHLKGPCSCIIVDKSHRLF